KAQMRRAAATVYNLQKIRLCANGTVGADAAKPRNRRRNSRLSKDKGMRYIKYLVRGGGSGIRTHDTVSRIHAFQACALSHSAIPPRHGARQYNRPRPCDNHRQRWQSIVMIDRRALMLAVSAAVLTAPRARAATASDGAGRAV